MLTGGYTVGLETGFDMYMLGRLVNVSDVVHNRPSELIHPTSKTRLTHNNGFGLSERG